MKNKLKNCVKTITTLSLSLGAVFSAGGSTSVHAEEATTAWAWDPKFNIRALEIAEEIYKKEDDSFSLDVTDSAQDDIVQRLNTALSSGVTTGLPNIVLIEDYRAQSFLTAFPDSFYELTDYINADDFAPYKIEATSHDGKIYGIPFDTGVTGLYVRTDILEEAGYTLDDVTDVTWRELLEVGKGVKEKTDVKLFSIDMNDLGIVRSMMHSSGAWYTEEDGVTPNFANNDALKEAFSFLKDAKEADVLNIHNDWAQMLQAFNTGKVATVPQGNWITPSITAAEDQAGKWAVVAWPKQDNVEGSVNASNLGGSSFYVLNIDGAEKAAEFLAATVGSNEGFYRQILDEIGAIGTYTPLSETDAYDTEVEYFGGQKVYADFAQWAEEIPAINFGSHTYALEDIAVNALQEYLSGGDIDQVMENAQERAENAVR